MGDGRAIDEEEDGEAEEEAVDASIMSAEGSDLTADGDGSGELDDDDDDDDKDGGCRSEL